MYRGAAVVDGVPRKDKRPTWRAEIFLNRAGGNHGSSIAVRGPNRFEMEEARSDVEEFKKAAAAADESNVAKELRGLASRLKTEFERQKHIDSGHAGKYG